MPAVRLVNPSKLRRRRRRMPTALRRYWKTHRRAGKRIVSTAAHNPRRRRRNMPAGLKRYWAQVRRAMKANPRRHRRHRVLQSNPHTKGVKHMAHRRRRRRMPAALARYWASHRRRRHNPSRHRRRNAFHFGGRRRRNRVRYVSAPRYSRRRRHNPFLSVPLGDLVVLTGWAVGGMAAGRILPQMVLPSMNSGLTGYGLNALTAVGLSWAGGRFFGARAAQGLLVGGMVGLAARILTDVLGSSQAGAWGLSGDLDFDLGFYVPNSFAVPTTGQGPYLLNPGITGSPMQAGGIPTMQPVTVAAGAAGGAAAASGGGVTAAQLSQMPGVSGNPINDPNAWRSNWAA